MSKFWCAVSAVTFFIVGIPTVSAQMIQGQWTGTGTMQSPREFGAQVLLGNGNLLAIGGVDNNNNVLSSAEVYSGGAWKFTKTSMCQARKYFSAVVLNTGPNKGQVLVVGGLDGSNIVLSGAELYNPTAGTCSSARSLSVPRFGHTATLLPSGKVLVTGGCASNYPCSSDTNAATSELYDPTTNTWSKTGSLNTARYYHTAVLLHTGEVLVIGGWSSANGKALSSCELYNPLTGKWTNAASTNSSRYLNGTTLLSDGKVLVTGGANGKSPMPSAELYDPLPPPPRHMDLNWKHDQ